MELAQLLNQTKRRSLNRIELCTKHKHMCRNILEEIVEDYPEYDYTILCFSQYDVLEWLKRGYKAYNDNIIDIYKLINNRTQNALGMHLYDTLNHEKTIAIFEIISEFIVENSKKMPVIYKIAILKQDVSKYLVSQRFKNEVMFMCEHISKRVNKTFKEKEILFSDEDIEFVFHNTKELLRLYNDKTLRKKNENINYLAEHIDQEINKLKDYPTNGKDIYEIVRLYCTGIPESTICKVRNKSSTYIRSVKRQADYLLSVLFWGKIYNFE